MQNIKRRKVFGHRIQEGKAIVDILFYEEDSFSKLWGERKLMKWIGDAYELRDELDEVIKQLEAGKGRKES